MNTSTLISHCQLTDAEAALNSDLTAWLARGEASVYDAEGDCLGDAKTPAAARPFSQKKTGQKLDFPPANTY